MRRTIFATSMMLFSCACLFADESLVAHWKLAGDALDASGNGLHGQPHGVQFVEQSIGGQLCGVAI